VLWFLSVLSFLSVVEPLCFLSVVESLFFLSVAESLCFVSVAESLCFVSVAPSPQARAFPVIVGLTLVHLAITRAPLYVSNNSFFSC